MATYYDFVEPQAQSNWGGDFVDPSLSQRPSPFGFSQLGRVPSGMLANMALLGSVPSSMGSGIGAGIAQTGAAQTGAAQGAPIDIRPPAEMGVPVEHAKKPSFLSNAWQRFATPSATVDPYSAEALNAASPMDMLGMGLQLMAAGRPSWDANRSPLSDAAGALSGTMSGIRSRNAQNMNIALQQRAYTQKMNAIHAGVQSGALTQAQAIAMIAGDPDLQKAASTAAYREPAAVDLGDKKALVSQQPGSMGQPLASYRVGRSPNTPAYSPMAPGAMPMNQFSGQTPSPAGAQNGPGAYSPPTINRDPATGALMITDPATGISHPLLGSAPPQQGR